MAPYMAIWLVLAHIIGLSLASITEHGCRDHLQCVALGAQDSELNRHLCERVGLTPCKESNAVLTVSSSVVSDSINRERCLQTLFGALASVTCQRSAPTEQHIYSPKGNGIAVAYLCPEVCKAIWMACSPRANSPFAELLVEEESKTICKNIAIARSPVQVRQGSDGKCISRIVPLSESDIAEINWLLGGKVNWHFLRLRGYSMGIIVLLVLLAAGTVYTQRGYRQRRKRVEELKREAQESDAFLELNVNMY